MFLLLPPLQCHRTSKITQDARPWSLALGLSPLVQALVHHEPGAWPCAYQATGNGPWRLLINSLGQYKGHQQPASEPKVTASLLRSSLPCA